MFFFIVALKGFVNYIIEGENITADIQQVPNSVYSQFNTCLFSSLSIVQNYEEC
jgi:hypothetical protein